MGPIIGVLDNAFSHVLAFGGEASLLRCHEAFGFTWLFTWGLKITNPGN
jgi:hypothetical protein